MPTPSDTLTALGHDLTENGLAFLHRAVSEMGNGRGDLRNISFAVVDLAAAIEVLLKARLVREHWTLICAEPDKAAPTQMVAGSLKTVSPEGAMKRLEGVAGVPMMRDGHSERVDEVMRLRHRAIHFTLAGQDPIGLQAALGRGLDFVLWFLEAEFRDQGDDAAQALVEESIDDLTTQVGKVRELVKARIVTIAAELDAAELCVQCPRCSQATLMFLDGQTSRCAFCLWKPADGYDCAQEYVDAVLGISKYIAIKEGGDWPIHSCPQCGVESMVQGIVQLRPDPAFENLGEPPCDSRAAAFWGCFACGWTADRNGMDMCTRCGVPTTTGDDDGTPICADCWSYILSSD